MEDVTIYEAPLLYYELNKVNNQTIITLQAFKKTDIKYPIFTLKVEPDKFFEWIRKIEKEYSEFK
jgi:hypothetical protein